MKKKALLTSVLTILLCVSIIAGSTFALFTDSTDFNIAVTSGDVEIVASAKVTGLYSAVGADRADDKFLVDENGKNYTHAPMTNGYFLNGGTAKLDGNRGLVIERITPGDRVDINIAVENKSDVAISYRYHIIADNGSLATGMVVTVDGVAHESLASWTSQWYPVVPAGDGRPYAIADKPISIELPVYAGNEYQTEANNEKTVNYTILVEAVQGNAVTDDESETIIYRTEKTVGNSIGTTYEGKIFEEDTLTDALVLQELYLLGNASVLVERTYNTVVLENVTADVVGNLINASALNTYVIVDCQISLDAGELIIEVDDITTQIILSDVYVNGVLVTDANVANYIKGSSNIMIENS